jgi:hypothetical protein
MIGAPTINKAYQAIRNCKFPICDTVSTIAAPEQPDGALTEGDMQHVESRGQE